MTEEKPRWGGKREGAGRKPSDTPRMVERTITLPPDMAQYLEQLGNGNLSAGVREAVRRLGEFSGSESTKK